jgi:hypothetical protein
MGSERKNSMTGGAEQAKQVGSSALADPQPPPIFRHSIAWSLLTAAFAVTLVFYALGAAYVGGVSRVWLAGFLAAAGILALGGAAYSGFLFSRRPRTITRLALAPVVALANLFSLLLAIAAAFEINW